MTENNEDMQQPGKENEPDLLDIEKIELNLPGIFDRFRKVLQEYGVSQLAVVEFRLDDVAQLEQALEIESQVSSDLSNRTTASGICRCPCGNVACFKVCPC